MSNNEKVLLKIKKNELEQIMEIADQLNLQLEYKLQSDIDGLKNLPGVSPKQAIRIKNEYQLKKSRYYLGSDYLYRENVYFIRQYPEYKKLMEQSFMEFTTNDDTGIRSGKIGKPTENEAMKKMTLEEMKRKIRIIDEAIKTIPKVYQEGVFNHVVYQMPYADKTYFYAHTNTWKSWTQKFVYEVAIRRGQGTIIELLKQ